MLRPEVLVLDQKSSSSHPHGTGRSSVTNNDGGHYDHPLYDHSSLEGANTSSIGHLIGAWILLSFMTAHPKPLQNEADGGE